MTFESSSSTIWEALAREGREVVTSAELEDLASRVELLPKNAVRHLRRSGFLLPLFKGFYYVRTPSEARLHTPGPTSLDLFALGANAKRIGEWYFGLHTALRLNGMTHEDRREETVVSRSFYRIRGERIGDGRFVIHKWGPSVFGFGLVRRGAYRYSDPEKTVLDLAYLDYWRVRRGHPAARTWKEFIGRVHEPRIRRYSRHYPNEMSRAVVAEL